MINKNKEDGRSKYCIQLISNGLSFPTSLTFDDTGVAYIAESGLPFGNTNSIGGCIKRVNHDGKHTILIKGLRAPVNGLTFYDGHLYVSEGGHPGRISRFDLDGKHQTIILDNLPGPGNYHTNMVAFGPDGKMYFSQGAMTNTGIIGLDAYELGWLRRLPHAHDIPGYDIVLAGIDVETINPLSSEEGQQRVQTGAFVPFGTNTKPGERIERRLPCTAAIMQCNPDGSNLELVAWGIRNAYGIGFLPDGSLIATDQGPDDRGSRPIGNAPDLLFKIHKGAWYGWPDFIGGVPVTSANLKSSRKSQITFVLSNHNELPKPELPLLRFPPNSAAVKFDVAPSDFTTAIDDHGLGRAQIFVALFGDEKPLTAPIGPHAGRTVVRIDLHDMSLHSVLDRKEQEICPFARPIDIRFNPFDGGLYVLDFGRFEIGASNQVIAQAETGRIYRLLPGNWK